MMRPCLILACAAILAAAPCPARAADAPLAKDAPRPAPERPDTVMGTQSPDIFHYHDSATGDEVWGVHPAPPAEQPAAPPLIVEPDIFVPWPGKNAQERVWLKFRGDKP